MTKDPIVNTVIEKYKARSERGMVKYGTTLLEHDTDLLGWLDHAQEEAMDFTLYLERLRVEILTLVKTLPVERLGNSPGRE